MKTFERKSKSVFMVFVSFLLVSFFLASAACILAFAQPQAQYKEGELLVKFKKGVPESSVAKAHATLGSRVLKHFRRTGIQKVELRPGLTTKQALEQYRKDPNVEYAEPDYKIYYQSVPNDPLFVEQWALYNTAQWHHSSYGDYYGTFDADIDALEAWDMMTGSSDVVVAVFDTGVDYTHEDLAANMWTNDAELNGTPGFDDDGNGYIDDIYGINPGSDNNDPMDGAGAYHGTQCAGIIGAVADNDLGVSGVSRNVKILAVRMEGASVSNALEGLEYVMMMNERGHNIRVTSNSWIAFNYSFALYDAIRAAGDANILFVAAAGNTGNDNDAIPVYSYPASFDLPNIISVAATDDHDNRAVWGMGGSTSFGATTVDVAAPGKDVLTTVATADTHDYIDGHPYGLFSGTSSATPHVAGVCALVWSKHPTLTWDGVKSIVLNTVDYVEDFRHDGPTPILTQGRVNAQKAVRACSSTGFVSLDRQGLSYTVPATVRIGLSDCDLNLDSGTVETVNIVISSGTEPLGEMVTLTEIGPDVGYFQGTVNISLSDSVGTLWVSHGDTITATYEDASPAGTRTSSATIDVIAPTISDVSATEDAGGEKATITWNTDENSYSILHLGDSPDNLNQKVYGWEFDVNHTLEVTGLVPGQTYYYDCEAKDLAGNATIDDNGGIHYQVTMPCVADISVSLGWLSMYALAGESVQAVFSIENTIGCDSLTFNINSDSNWLTAQPSAGTVQPGGSRTITVTADAASLAPEDYPYVGGLTINSNDPDSQELGVVVLLYVDSATTWAKTYGTANTDSATSITQTSDGGYLLLGVTDDGTYLNDDALILKLDSLGNIQWQKTYGGSINDFAYSGQQTSDGDYIVAGCTYSFGKGSSDAWVMKLDQNGNILWQKTYGRTGFECIYAIQQTQDGGYIAAGERLDNTGAYWKGIILKLDAQGDIVWQKKYGSTANDHHIRSIDQTSDGGYIVAGEASNGSGDVWVSKLLSDGTIQWQKRYGGFVYDTGFAIQQSDDGGYIVVGRTESFGAGSSDALILKLDSSGKVQWQKALGGTNWDEADAVQKTSDGGYIVAGYLYSEGTFFNLWVFKLDQNGNILWQKSTDAMGYHPASKAMSIQETDDGGFIVAGGTDYNGAGRTDLYLLRFDSNGNNCNMRPSNAAFTNTSVDVHNTSVPAQDSDLKVDTSNVNIGNQVTSQLVCQ